MYLHKKRRVVAKLVGGLGNQLFIYFAALNLATVSNRELVLDMSFIEKSHSSGHSRLDDFHLKGIVVDSNIICKKIKEYREKLIDYLSLRGISFFSRNFLDEKFPDKLVEIDKVNKIYLRGFHNSAKHYEALGSPSLMLKTETAEYRRLRESLKEAVAIHLRGGDYNQYKATFGPLSYSYYLNILESNSEISSIALANKIYLFSDDWLRSQNLSNLLRAEGFQVVEISFEHNLYPAEELLLMSNAKVIIAANSTFSFWATELSAQSAIIISPSNYMRSGPEVDFESSRQRILSTSDWEK